MIAAYELWRPLSLSVFSVVLSVSLLSAQGAAGQAKKPLDYANGLVGTAPLDDPKLIGNAPPPGEQLYSGFTSPGARLPHSSTELAPINANLDVSYPAGVRASYFYPNRTIFGFSSGADDNPTVMPVVGDWTVPPERSGSVYDKKQEKASPGYYSVYLDDYRTKVEMTATTWTGIFRFTFPQTEKANILLDLGFPGGEMEIVNDRTVRGRSRDGRTYFLAEFSKSFTAFGTFKQIPPRHGECAKLWAGHAETAVRSRSMMAEGVGANGGMHRSPGHSDHERERRGRTSPQLCTLSGAPRIQRRVLIVIVAESGIVHAGAYSAVGQRPWCV
jgi:Glycosyl hydrolase family 92 N-terminal domain